MIKGTDKPQLVKQKNRQGELRMNMIEGSVSIVKTCDAKKRHKESTIANSNYRQSREHARRNKQRSRLIIVYGEDSSLIMIV